MTPISPTGPSESHAARDGVGTGPLDGIRIVEIAGIGPGPHAGMVLSDLGADVIRIERPGRPAPGAERDVFNRGRPSVSIDLKHPDGVETVLKLVEHADALIEGFRPGVMERLGIGPDACLERNNRLVYGRMTGWGQNGPLSHTAGHDINYLAISGVLHGLRRRGGLPTPPLNLLGDFGGGSMFLVAGVLAALLHAGRSGEGQVVDAAIVDGTAVLATMVWALRAMDRWDSDAPGTNLVDTGAHFYEVYECADGGYIAVGAYEPQFYAACLRGLGLADEELPEQMDSSQWPLLKERFATIFRTKTRAEWEEVFTGTDACVSPVLSPDEALQYPHLKARRTFAHEWNVDQPATAPRFSRTPGTIRRPPSNPQVDGDGALVGWGFTEADVATLRQAGVLPS